MAFSSAGAALDDEVTARLDGAADRLGHLLLPEPALAAAWERGDDALQRFANLAHFHDGERTEALLQSLTTVGARMNRTDRLYAIVEQLRAVAPRARTSRQLAEHFEVSTRTIERDLLALQEAGVPIWATPGPGGGYAVDPTMSLPPLNFTTAEATAIAVALAVSGPVPFADAARAALRKVVAAMPANDRARADDLVGRIHLLERRGQLERTPVLAAVERAILDQAVLEIDYIDKDGSRTVRLVEPFGFTGTDESWYLLGWCRLRSGGRTFRLDRIRGATVTDEAAPPRSLAEVAGPFADRMRPLLEE
jgi:predicted DNA-binding transcriptional regulator YafY